MKDYNRERMESAWSRASHKLTFSALEKIEFCLDQLGADDTKEMSDDVVDRCTFEELTGALLHAKEMLEALDCDD